MSRPLYDIKEVYLGTGDTSSYDFDFKIEDPTQLLIIEDDGMGNELNRVRGDDNVFLSGVVFDAIEGGGTVTLAADLIDTHVLTMLLANDAPTQPTTFGNKMSFTLQAFEMAMDFITGAVQRLAYLAQRSVKLHDLDDSDNIDPTLPQGVANNPGATIAINSDGTGLAFGATLGQIAAANGYATMAAASANASAASATAAAASAVAAAASAAQAAAGAIVYGTRASPLNITASGGITSHGTQSEMQLLHGSPGAVVISANPQISPGTMIGQTLMLCGADDTNTVTLTNGNGLSMNGDIILGLDDVIMYFWDTVNWIEMFRRH